MRRIISLIAAVAMILCSVVFSSAAEQQHTVESVAVQLINDALTHPECFGLPELGDEEIYICEGINPFTKVNDEMTRCQEIEYYFVRTESEYIACITVCIVEGEPKSACLDVSLANKLNEECGLNDAVRLIVQNGELQILTNNTARDNELSSYADKVTNNFEIITIKSELAGIQINGVNTRSSKILSVPYVKQVSNTCWAAAGASFGRYYTGNKYSHLDAVDLANEMGVAINTGASMETTQKMLKDVFGINTIYKDSSLSHQTAISMFQQGKPIIAGFYVDRFLVSDMGHMVVLCGFDDNNTGETITYYIRDPKSETMKSVMCASDEALTLDRFLGKPMQWIESLYYGTSS